MPRIDSCTGTSSPFPSARSLGSAALLIGKAVVCFRPNMFDLKNLGQIGFGSAPDPCEEVGPTPAMDSARILRVFVLNQRIRGIKGNH